jgi:hypothetical protein
MVGTIAAIVSAMAGPAAPIVVPIAAGIVLAVWVHDVYQMSYVVLLLFLECKNVDTSSSAMIRFSTLCRTSSA